MAFALSMKELVLNTTENIKTIRQPADALRGIVAALSELDVRPTGEHLKTYQEIHSLASAAFPSANHDSVDDLAKIP